MALQNEQVPQALKKLRVEKARLTEIEASMDKCGSNQYCTTEPDAHLMRSGREGMVLGYNIQSAVESSSGLITHHEVTRDAADNRQLQPMAKRLSRAACR